MWKQVFVLRLEEDEDEDGCVCIKEAAGIGNVAAHRCCIAASFTLKQQKVPEEQLLHKRHVVKEEEVTEVLKEPEHIVILMLSIMMCEHQKQL